jgi:hypothetical protein
MTAQDRGLTGDQISVLEMLAWLSERLCRIGAEGQRLHDRVARRIDPRRTRDRDAGDRGGRRPNARCGETGDHGEGAVNDRPMNGPEC